jgi:hypothetical protein
MNPDRQQWNDRQQELRLALLHPTDMARVLDLFLRQHAATHSAALVPDLPWSFADEAWQGLPEASLRQCSAADGHSIAWVFWHLARIEDLTMNHLVAGSSQVFMQAGWQARLRVPTRHTGNAMTAASIAELSAAIDLEALQAYRLAVGRRTRLVAAQLQPANLKQKVAPERLGQLQIDGFVTAEAADALGYWGRLTIAGLLLMPPTRHNFIHLNEALRLRKAD